MEAACIKDNMYVMHTHANSRKQYTTSTSRNIFSLEVITLLEFTEKHEIKYPLGQGKPTSAHWIYAIKMLMWWLC
jgi:hypothetical protein